MAVLDGKTIRFKWAGNDDGEPVRKSVKVGRSGSAVSSVISAPRAAVLPTGEGLNEPLDDAIGFFRPAGKQPVCRRARKSGHMKPLPLTRTHKGRRENRSADQLSKMGAVSLRSRPGGLITITILRLGCLISLKSGWWGKPELSLNLIPN